MTKRILAVAVMAMLSLSAIAQGRNYFFKPQGVWYDTDGNPINAHGGGIMKY